MSILNPLPELLSFSFIAPLFLRLVVGIYFLEKIYPLFYAKKKKGKNENILKGIAGVEGLAALAVIIGFYTQIAVLVLIVATIINLALKTKKGGLKKEEMQLSVFVLVTLLSLLVTGAGFLAIDMPL